MDCEGRFATQNEGRQHVVETGHAVTEPVYANCEPVTDPRWIPGETD